MSAAPSLKNTNQVHVTEGLLPADVLQLIIDGASTHVCQRDGHSFDIEKQSSELLINSPDFFFKFPVASIFSPASVNEASEASFKALDVKFHNSSQKRNVIDQAVQALESKGLSRTLIEDVSSVADEMFTNAVYNAPFVDGKTHKNPGVSRHDFEVSMGSGLQGRLILAFDKTRLMVACQDPFGSLSLPKYLIKIKATYEHGAAATMNFGPGGAGLGSYIIFNTGCSLYAGVMPGSATLLCCILPLGMSNRKRSQISKNLHLIQL